MDLIVRLPETTNKFSYILVIKCRMSQYLIAVPLQSKKAKEVAEAVYKNLYCQHGAVRRVTTDRGGEFVNNIHQAINQLLAQRGTSTTPYNPQSNGQAENAVRSIKDMLSAYAYRNQTNWDVYLPVIVHAYNTTINAVTGYSPFFIVHGREARRPTDQWMEDYVDQLHDQTLAEYILELQQVMLDAWETAADRKTHAQGHIQQHHLRHTRPVHQFQPGDLFFKRSIPERHILDPDDFTAHRLSLKLQDRYTGPHVVIRQLSPVTYRCSINGRIQVVHLNKMKRDCSALNNVRDQRRDLFDNEDLVEERAAVPPADYVHEIEEVEETILLEVDEEDEYESFEHIDDLSTPALFNDEEEENTNRNEQDHEATNEVVDTWEDNPMDAIATDATTHQGIVAEPIFNFVVLDNLS
jgi:hypothetical protein